MYNSQIVAERVKELSKHKHKSVTEVLLSASLGKNTVAKLANGTDILTQNIYKIADALNCSVDYLLGRTDNPQISSNYSEIDELYNQLDLFDKTEIRGEIKQMLKADKYKTEKPQPKKQQAYKLVAFGGDNSESNPKKEPNIT